jgi:acetolactate synthase small subunit
MNSANSIRTIRMLIENHSEALLKVEKVFITRAHRISALNVAQGEEMRQITVAVRCNESQFQQLRKQLMKIVDVLEVTPGIQDDRPLTPVAGRQELRTA